ncbi:bestrophin family protein [Aureivirga sp. CE67]|uniref:bestrophin family protein n=1 Tax=Aureivirga sp. CE67 TaxID=1788983 RepID=UPI0018CAADFD|nr:bestrophin family ion channel [Aureivirga sp. CE67]
MILDKSIPIPYIIGQIRVDLVYVVGFAIAMFVIEQFITLNIPLTIPAFLGTAISLILSFRLAQSYQRWWEARKIWGAIVNDSRSLVVQVKNFSRSHQTPEVENIIKEIANIQIAWCHALSKSLRKQNATDFLDKYISKEEKEQVSKHSNVPLALVDLNSSKVQKLFAMNVINNFQYVEIDATFVRLVASMGKAERIKNTVFPKMYCLLLHVFIYVFLCILDIAMVDIHPVFEFLIILVIAMTFFLLERTAFNLQDPFENKPTDTPTTAISNTIELNLKQLVNEKHEMPKTDEKQFYLL